MLIHIKTASETSSPLKVNPSITVHELKTLIEAVFGVEHGQQRLQLDGKVLLDFFTLEESEFSDGCKIVLTKKNKMSQSETRFSFKVNKSCACYMLELIFFSVIRLHKQKHCQFSPTGNLMDLEKTSKSQCIRNNPHYRQHRRSAQLHRRFRFNQIQNSSFRQAKYSEFQSRQSSHRCSPVNPTPKSCLSLFRQAKKQIKRAMASHSS